MRAEHAFEFNILSYIQSACHHLKMFFSPTLPNDITQC